MSSAGDPDGIGFEPLTADFELVGDEEGDFEALLGVKAGIAERVIPFRQRRIGYCLGAPGALGHVLPGHFDMDATGMGAFRLMDGEETPDLIGDAGEWPRLVAGRRLDGVAVHGIARPDDLTSFPLHGPYQRRKMRLHLDRVPSAR